jgi:hypothetical protein
MQDVFKGGDLAWARKGQALKGTIANRQSPLDPDHLSIIRGPKILPPNLVLANRSQQYPISNSRKKDRSYP